MQHLGSVNVSPEPIALPCPPEDPTSPLAPGTHTITVRHGSARIEQRYHVAGTGPVCIAHSGGPGISWEYLRMPLLERSLTMVYIEPVGTGASGFLADPREYTLARYTHFLHAVIQHLALPDVVLLGHSHGGFVAQRYALDHPGRVAALVLYDTSPVTGEGFWSAAVANLERFVQRHIDEHPEVAGYVAALTTRLDQLTDDGTTAVLRKITPAYFYDYWGREQEFGPARQSLRMYAAPTQFGGHPFDVRDELSAVTAPTLVLVGKDDFICGPHWARMIHHGIAEAQLVVLDETGHMAHLERPEEFCAEVTGFLALKREEAQ
ncbi:alpha/beta fold hydrolase [Streptomyces sp. NBC_00154]|uniref:alpha/beta fold hydrolase n=1 Tax=Streptomyces sp. NBC_00154 TaxID=2975670 RepID=UPI0022563ACB|nr:alpha/beta hydrolase [Streptomyces sp. NBC_00154]MCX5317920.1 alpha/beta hydrolase [Streptomyces sp. NBC_00154]